MAFASASPSKASVASLALDESPRATDHHPLDPSESFVYIDSPIPALPAQQKTEYGVASKDAASSNLEDGWDLVDELDDRPATHTNNSLTVEPALAKGKRVEAPLSKSRSVGLSTSRGASSMPPLSTSSTRTSETGPNAQQVGSSKGANDPSLRRRSKSGSKVQSTELTSNSGFKHRIYCTLYNLYHAQPSETPALSNAPIYMMGAILASLPDSESSSRSLSSSQALYGTSYRGKEKAKGAEAAKTSKDEFLEMSRSLVFFSYRKDFTRLEGFNVTSDVGWGCMLRTGQMLLATALQRLHEPLFANGTGWRGMDRGRGRMPVGQELMTPANAQIISQIILEWFRDAPDMDRHPYSIHNLVRTSLALNPSSEGAVTGPSWFSPTKLARILRFLVRVHSPERLTMYVPPEGVIYVDEVVALCTEPHTSTLNPPTQNAQTDRTFLWWKRYSANGPSVSRSLTIPDYDDQDTSDGDENDIDLGNLENDALYQRALAESIAQYESESYQPSPSNTHHTPIMNDSTMLSWTTRDWMPPSASQTTSVAPSGATSSLSPRFPSDPNTLGPTDRERGLEDPNSALRKRSSSANAQQQPTTLASAPVQDTSIKSTSNEGTQPRLSESVGAIPRNLSLASNNSLEASSTWVQLSAMNSARSSLEPIPSITLLPGMIPSSDDPIDSYFASPEPVLSSYNGPLNLSAIVENHEDLTGSPKIKFPMQEARNEDRKEPWTDFGTHSPPYPTAYLSPPTHAVSQAQPSNNRLLASYQASPVSGWTAPPSSYASPTPSPLTPSGGYLQGTSPSPYSSLGSNDEFGTTQSKKSKRSGILEDTVFVMVPENSSPPQTTTLAQMSISPGVASSSGASGSLGSALPFANAPAPVQSGTGNFAAPNECWRPLLLLIPSRLGINKVNPVYIEHLKFSLSSSSSVGIVGGKPNKSLYFFAFQEDYVFYLDPHFVHTIVKPVDAKGQVHESYKVRFPQKTKFLDLDPSLALGFFIRTRADFEAFLQTHHTFAIQAQDDPTTEPIFTIQDTAPDYLKR